MNKNKNPTDKCLSELPFIFCGKSGDIEVYEDTEPELIEHLLAICEICNVTLRLVKRKVPLCTVCGKPLTRNGTKTNYLDDVYSFKLQKYNHEKCPDSSCICSAKALKKEKHTYSKKVQEKSILINLTNPESYQKKAEEIANETGAYPDRSTLYYYHKNHSDELFELLEYLQFQRITELNITPSGKYHYDEQYVFINKKLYLRLTIIDYKNKLIIADELVSEEEFNDQTIENFLKKHLENLPLDVIITDGRKGYKTIIEALGAIQHRCFFHVMQNLMTPLQKYKNKLTRRINTLTNKIQKKEKKITEIQAVKKKYRGPIPKSDKKTRRQHNRIIQLKNKIKEHKKEIREKTKELKEINKDQERIQNIWDSKNIKQAKRRYNTIHNQKDYLNPIIAKFLDNIESDLDVILNHLIDTEIPATNNTIENYFRTTLPRSQKRIFRTKEGLQRRIREQQIRWIHRIVLKQNTPININTTYH